MKLAKNQANAKQFPEAEFCILNIIHIFHPRYRPKITLVLKIKQKKSYTCKNDENEKKIT